MISMKKVLDILEEAPSFDTEVASDKMFHKYMEVKRAMLDFPEVNAIYLLTRPSPDGEVYVLADAAFEDSVEGYEQSCELSYAMTCIFGKTVTMELNHLWDDEFGDDIEVLDELVKGRFFVIFRQSL